MRHVPATLDTVMPISLGAVLGANARYWLGLWIARATPQGFPLATLPINVRGSFVLALRYTLAVDKGLVSIRAGTACLTGFFGSYSTFSTLMPDSVQPAQQTAMLSIYETVASVVLGLLAAAGGMWCVRSIDVTGISG